MEKTEKIRELKALLSPAIERQGAFLVELAIKGDSKRELLEVFCDTEKGITINQCAEISREILPLVDASQILGGNFRLEVSSPGVGVPLRDRRQYKSNMGRLMSVKFRDGSEVKDIEGDLTDLTDETIVLKTETASVELGFDSIIEARAKIRW
ncbi:MAG: hypothetical protein M1378_01065 [Bacteroidetes bacterium]|jgi:ribosome maturation factor RimP|nr:hypothetical protein [Bacteroidota bacterium]MCL5034003.1 hypothetical protein [Bacteroidota bacterium]